jgi:hypothetical protein
MRSLESYGERRTRKNPRSGQTRGFLNPFAAIHQAPARQKLGRWARCVEALEPSRSANGRLADDRGGMVTGPGARGGLGSRAEARRLGFQRWQY